LSEINNEEKQSINNIKSLYKINADGLVPSLFHEVKRAKQQAFSLVNNYKDRLASLKQEQEQKLKQELLKEQAKYVEANKQNNLEANTKTVRKPEPEDNMSFAELFESNEKQQKLKQQSLQKKEETPSKSSISTSPATEKQEKANVEETKKEVAPVKAENASNNLQGNAKPMQNQNVKAEGFKSYTPRTNDNRQNNNFRNQGNYNNQNNFNNNTQGNYRQNNYQGYNRQNNFAQRPYNQEHQNQNGYQHFQKPYNNQNGFNKPNNNQGFRPYNNAQNGNNNGSFNRFQKPYVASNNSANGSLRSQNKSLVSNVIPKKNNNLTSAASVFATKERAFGNKKKTNERSGEDERKINKKSLLRRGLIEEQNIEERMVTRKLKLKKPKTDVTPVVCAPITNAVITTSNLTVKILSEKIGKPVTEIIKQLMLLGIMTTINSPIDFPTAELVSNELGVTLELKLEKTFEEKLKENAVIDDGTNNEKRPPIVTIVGHVDHGKTSLLDYIRKTHVTSGEAGGITQKIGAYSINWKGEDITFIDTPGHEAFMNMRKRGTEITDVAILIVAGDDGIKPQTVEAIKHIKQAKVPMIVAITKMDKPDVNVDKIKQQLTEHDVLPEEWGGDAIIVPVSSVTGQGIDKLLEIILLVAEMQNLKCNKKREAVGTIIEAELDKNRGPIANIIVQNGTLKLGDNIVSGFALGKVRAMIDDKGKSISKAGPSMPVSILGFDSVPNAGDPIQVVDEKFSKNVIAERKIKMAQDKIEAGKPKSLDEFLSTPVKEDKKVLNLLLKANSQGSVEALKQSLLEIKNDEVKIEIIYSGVGNINENDIQLAKVSNATIIAFDTKVLSKISNFAKQNKVEIKEYDIIYRAIEDMEKVLKSLMAPKYEEKIMGHAEVRALFKISSVGTIAGCYVLDGKIVRNSEVKVTRKDAVVFEGKIATLKREKDDVKEVAAGYECGIKIDNYNDIAEGDIIECIVKQQINV